MDFYLERKDYNSMITIKLFIPSGCNAKCEFCYMKDCIDVINNNDKDIFLNNFIDSLDYLLTEINDKNKVSLDITGNEPTFDKELLIEVMKRLKEFNIKEKVSRVTITTNGLNLEHVLPYFKDVISYVNISVHHFNQDIRNYIFGCKSLRFYNYLNCISELEKLGIPCSAVCVVYRPILDFETFMDRFILWCRQAGFISLRFRNDVFWEDSCFESYMDIALADPSFKIISNEDTKDSRWCRLRLYDGFRVFFLKGVKDTSVVSPGVEYAILDDGKAYADFYKRNKIEDYAFKIGKVYDKFNIQ